MIEYGNEITAEEYMELRRLVGWMEFPLEEAQAGLDNAYMVVSVRDEGRAIGVMRLLWDGGYIAFISDVIVAPEYQGQGICFAKSHLLAAILRAKGLPTGFCYQKLILDDETAPVLLYHGLNGVYIRGIDRWIRLDARGNKPGVDAQFSLDTEQLAFPIRPEWGEKTILQEKENCYLYEKTGYNQTGKVEKINERMDIVFYEKD